MLWSAAALTDFPVIQKQIEDEEENQKAIEEKAAYQKTDAYIEDLARDKLGLVHENEIIFKKK